MHVVWLAEGYTWGPLTRAVAVLGAARQSGHVLAQRSIEDNEPLVEERIPFVHAECCGAMTMQNLLAGSVADVVIADMCWARLALASGQPYVILGMHGAGTWDLDAQPIHPWAWQPLPRRKDVRLFFDVDDETPVVAVLSPKRMGNVIENVVRPHIPEHARLVSLTGVGAARRMVGADLVLASAGWASTWEARWSGVPYALVDVGGRDQASRATHSWAGLTEAVKHVRVADLPPEHTASPDDHVTEFDAVLRRLAEE